MSKILITPRSLTQNGHPELERIKKAGYEIIFSNPGTQPTEEELIKLLPGCVGMLAGIEKITAKVLENAKDLKIISRNGTGVDNIDLKTCEKLNIKVAVANGANSYGVAELTIGLIMAIIRSIPYSNNYMKLGNWKRKIGSEVKGKTLGLVGCGKIGRIVAQEAIYLGMKVIGYDIYEDIDFKQSKDFKYTTLENIFQTSDIISLHCPMQPDGKAVIDKNAILKMKKGIFIVNTARAGLINEKDVLEGLNNNQIAGYATDVYQFEPPELNDLLKHENVILTPHIGGYTNESVEKATRIAVDNLLEELKSFSN